MQKIVKILWAILGGKAKKVKRHLFWPLNRRQSGIKNFLEKSSRLNNTPYCPLKSCKTLGRSLDLFWRKGKKTPHRRTDGMTDRGRFGSTSKVGGSKNWQWKKPRTGDWGSHRSWDILWQTVIELLHYPSLRPYPKFLLCRHYGHHFPAAH